MKTTSRLGVVCLLLLVASGLCVLYAGADRWAAPDTATLSIDRGSVDGQQALVFGDVQSVDQSTGQFVIQWGSDPQLQLTVENVPPRLSESVQPGAAIQVYGTFEQQSTVMVAEEIVVDYHGTADRRYVYLTSILGGLIAAGVFLRYWRINWHKGRFEPRGNL